MQFLVAFLCFRICLWLPFHPRCPFVATFVRIVVPARLLLVKTIAILSLEIH